MKTVVLYKTKYGSTKAYAEWIKDELNCDIFDATKMKADDLSVYDTIIYGGGLYAEVIAGVSLITKNIEKFKNKNIIVYTTGLTPPDCRDYYDKLVVEKNFKGDTYSCVKMFNYPGKMILSELSLVHRTALKTLKKLMSDKQNPTEMEKLLIELCDADGDFSDKAYIKELVDYVKKLEK